MYYQIENSEHQIVDVVEGENWVCDFNTEVFHGIMRCDSTIADGIIGSDSNTIYHIAGRPLCGIGDYYVTLIDEVTYADLFDRLELGEVVEIEEPSDEPSVEEPQQETPSETQRILSRQELTEKVLALEAELEAARILLGVES